MCSILFLASFMPKKLIIVLNLLLKYIIMYIKFLMINNLLV